MCNGFEGLLVFYAPALLGYFAVSRAPAPLLLHRVAVRRTTCQNVIPVNATVTLIWFKSAWQRPCPGEKYA